MSEFTLDHLGIAVPDLAKALAFYRDTLGVACTHTEEIPDQMVRAAFLSAGETDLELLEPTSDDSPIAKFIAKRGSGGIHHIALRVQNLQETLDRLAAAGVQLIDREPRPGGHGKEIAFIHPKATGGVLLELCAIPQADANTAHP
ncbi:MAG: methylmalonyl-CoA epimerase [Candidatus Sericytochromatia bacterium]|nr:methylmalonyl-CoA epimerase [Candidatus Sericytochromatia bacterium]